MIDEGWSSGGTLCDGLCPVCEDSVFSKGSADVYHAQLDEFFGRLQTPGEEQTSTELRENQAVAGSIGKLCYHRWRLRELVGMILNPRFRRLCFIACGGVMVAVGSAISSGHRDKRPLLLSGGNESERSV